MFELTGSGRKQPVSGEASVENLQGGHLSENPLSNQRTESQLKSTTEGLDQDVTIEAR